MVRTWQMLFDLFEVDILAHAILGAVFLGFLGPGFVRARAVSLILRSPVWRTLTPAVAGIELLKGIGLVLHIGVLHIPELLPHVFRRPENGDDEVEYEAV